MNASQNTITTVRPNRRALGVVAATALAVALTALPAVARPDPGQIDAPAQSTTAIYFCPPERVGTQYVACDNLTGNGVPAPAWVHER